MIKDVTIDYLLNEFDREGLVAIGCGGDINEWFIGVNNILLEEKVTEKPQAIGCAYRFEYDDITCLLFPFPEYVADFKVSRLAIARLQYPWMKWWSDFKDHILEQDGGYDDEDDYEDDYEYYDDDDFEDDDCPIITPEEPTECPNCNSTDVMYGGREPGGMAVMCNHCGFLFYEDDEGHISLPAEGDGSCPECGSYNIKCSKGLPGETLYTCVDCGHVECDFNIGEVM